MLGLIDPVEDLPEEYWLNYPAAITLLRKWSGFQGISSQAALIGAVKGSPDVIEAAIEAAIAAPVPVALSRFPRAKDKELVDILERDLGEAEALLRARLLEILNVALRKYPGGGAL